MKQTSKIIYLLLAFVLPVGIFVFLRTFGRNEFDVPPLFAKEAPPQIQGCHFTPSAPYVVPDSIQRLYQVAEDSLTVIFFGALEGEELNQLDRIRENTAADPVQVIQAADNVPMKTPPEQDNRAASAKRLAKTANLQSDSVGATAAAKENATVIESIRRCIFFLQEKSDVVMVDSKGVIRGHYTASNRDEMDRLLTEVTILLKKY